MAISYEHVPDPRIAERRKAGPPKRADEHVGFNGRFALVITTVVGTMWCAYAFAVLALVALPSALGGGPLALIQWISQTFIQLVLLSIIMVGQNILGKASDKRAEMTYKDADAILHEALQIQAHLPRPPLRRRRLRRPRRSATTFPGRSAADRTPSTRPSASSLSTRGSSSVRTHASRAR